MPGFGRFGHRSKPLAVTVGIVLLFLVVWVVVARLAASLNDRYESFYPSLAEADKMAQSLAVGYQTIFCPAVLVLSTRFTIFRPRGNGVLSSLRLTIRKSFARTSRALMCYRRQFAVYETLTYRGGPAGSRAILIQAGFAVRGSISTRSKGQLMPS